MAWSSHHYVDAIKACLIACNQDPELVQIVTCLPDSVEALTGDPRIKHITFVRHIDFAWFGYSSFLTRNSTRLAVKRSERKLPSKAHKLVHLFYLS